VDWDATRGAVSKAELARLRDRLEELCAAGVPVFVLADGRLPDLRRDVGFHPAGPGRLFLCCEQGSADFEVIEDDVVAVSTREPRAEESSALDRAAERVADALADLGFDATVEETGRTARRVVASPRRADGPSDRSVEGSGTDPAPTLPATLGEPGLRALARQQAELAGLVGPQVTVGVDDIQLALTTKSDAAQFASDWLAERGITGELVLVVGRASSWPPLARAIVLPPGGRAGRSKIGSPSGLVGLAATLQAQLDRRAERRVPQVDPDPAWTFGLVEDGPHQRSAEALGSLCNGQVGVRGSREEGGPGTAPLFLAAGVYDHDEHLLPGPIWTEVDLVPAPGPSTGHRLLDLRTGVLVRVDEQTGLRSLRFVSIASPRLMAFRLEVPSSMLQPGNPVRSPSQAIDFTRRFSGDVCIAVSRDSARNIAVAARDQMGEVAGRSSLERLAAWDTSTAGKTSQLESKRLLREGEAAGFEALLAEHRRAWADRWADAEVNIEGTGAAADQLQVRLAVFHLLSAIGETAEAAVGARGMTGAAYAGHVFWDADIFVLPALAALRPEAARAMLEYRIRRLPAARATAEASGRSGARFPWESAGDGYDVTPRLVDDGHGHQVPIATGPHEEHIVADVAWAATHYTTWSSDRTFLARAGRALIVETARYWASRVQADAGGRYHIFEVMGPDEYHEVVDDNAYTNVMARWNLREGARLLRSERPDDREATHWVELADRLVDGWDRDRNLYEQFTGFFDLESLLVADIAPPPVAIDMLLGADRVARSQIIKQADVLMLHHLVPAEVAEGSLRPCLDFYEPRTAHGSSLSPAISASLLARAGRPDEALELFRVAARIDADDLTGTTAGGLHLATMGGVWQALAFGFLGLRADSEALRIDPCLPDAWSLLSMRMRFRGTRLRVEASHDRVSIDCDSPIAVRVGSRAVEHCEPPSRTFSLPGGLEHEGRRR
jgi:trehalose/maltose hydrolase-like predicted phosphorylase